MVELAESEAVPEMDAKPSFDVDKLPLPSVADLSPQTDRRASPSLVADVNSIKPGHAVSSGAPVSSAETTSSTPSDSVCRHTLSPSDGTSSSQTEMSEIDEDKPVLHSPALSGIIILCVAIRCSCIYLVIFWCGPTRLEERRCPVYTTRQKTIGLNGMIHEETHLCISSSCQSSSETIQT